MQDYDSKYGTLKVIQKPLLVEPGSKVFVQVGCIVMQLEVEQGAQKKDSCWSKLCGCLSRMRKKRQAPERAYMKRTLNPKDPVRNEV